MSKKRKFMIALIISIFVFVITNFSAMKAGADEPGSWTIIGGKYRCGGQPYNCGGFEN